VEANLRTLRTDSLALVNLRLMAPEARGGIPLAEQLAELAALRDEGKIESIGLSNATVEEVTSGLEMVDLGEVQNAYNILLRGDEDVLRLCADRGVPYVPFFPIGSPSTGGPRQLAENPTISSVAIKHDATPVQIALAWLLHTDEHILLIPGTSSVAHLEQNMAAAGIALDDEDLVALDRVARPHP
jgi:pyridoxine 4-dehydrogenase